MSMFLNVNSKSLVSVGLGFLGRSFDKYLFFVKCLTKRSPVNIPCSKNAASRGSLARNGATLTWVPHIGHLADFVGRWKDFAKHF